MYNALYKRPTSLRIILFISICIILFGGMWLRSRSSSTSSTFSRSGPENSARSAVRTLLFLHWHKAGTIASEQLAAAFVNLSPLAATLHVVPDPPELTVDAHPLAYTATFSIVIDGEEERYLELINRTECARVNFPCIVERARRVVPKSKLVLALANLGSYDNWNALRHMWHGAAAITGETPFELHHALMTHRYAGAPRIYTVVMHRQARRQLSSCVRYHGWGGAEVKWTRFLMANWSSVCESIIDGGVDSLRRRCSQLFDVHANASFHDLVYFENRRNRKASIRALSACSILLRDTIHGQVTVARMFAASPVDSLLLDVDELARSDSLDELLKPLCEVVADSLDVRLSLVQDSVRADKFRVGEHITDTTSANVYTVLDQLIDENLDFLQTLTGVSLSV